jgi:hypothetical protein
MFNIFSRHKRCAAMKLVEDTKACWKWDFDCSKHFGDSEGVFIIKGRISDSFYSSDGFTIYHVAERDPKKDERPRVFLGSTATLDNAYLFAEAWIEQQQIN